MTANTRPRDFADIARGLLRAFRQRRPLRGGSLITTVFGDSLAARNCEVSLSGLIELLAPFGLTERLVRTSIGRLAQDDWVTAHRVGRLSFYRLSAAGNVRFAAATRRIYAAPGEEWRGFWTTLIVAPGEEARLCAQGCAPLITKASSPAGPPSCPRSKTNCAGARR